MMSPDLILSILFSQALKTATKRSLRLYRFNLKVVQKLNITRYQLAVQFEQEVVKVSGSLWGA